MSLDETAESGVAETVLRELFSAAERGAVDEVRDCLSDTLLIYKVGRVKTREDLLNSVREFAARGGSARYAFTDIVSRADGRHASITYRSRAEISLPGEPVRHARWLESAILEQSDRWRIVFFHSTDEIQD